MNEYMETESEHKEILERLNQIEAQVQMTQTSIRQMRKFMFWRLIILLVAILVPTIALPIFLKIFFHTYMPGYLETLQTLLGS